MMVRRLRLPWAAVALLVVVALSGCAAPTSQTASAPCGRLNIAVNPWTGSLANAQVLGYVAKTRLGCQVDFVGVAATENWHSMEEGRVDVVPEVWGQADFVEQYTQVRKTVVDAGLTGGDATLGWYLPPWLAKEHPELTRWENLNTYSSLFVTPQSGGKGQLLSTDPTLVSNNNPLLANLGLDFNVVSVPTEAELIRSLQDSERHRRPLLVYFYAPQWIFSDLKLVRVKLPVYDSKKPECAQNGGFRCDYPQLALTKMASTRFMSSGSPAVTLVQNFSWTNNDQNSVARAIDRDHVSPEQAAKAWVEANPDKVSAWITPSR